MARLLDVPMGPSLDEGPHRVALPILPVRLRRGDHIGLIYNALVDTGSMFTVASQHVAADFKMGLDAVKASPDVVSLTGPGGAHGDAWGWDFELHLGDGGVSSRIVLPGARVYFTAWDFVGYDLVLGHHDALERLVFTLSNQTPAANRPMDRGSIAPALGVADGTFVMARDAGHPARVFVGTHDERRSIGH